MLLVYQDPVSKKPLQKQPVSNHHSVQPSILEIDYDHDKWADDMELRRMQLITCMLSEELDTTTAQSFIFTQLLHGRVAPISLVDHFRNLLNYPNGLLSQGYWAIEKQLVNAEPGQHEEARRRLLIFRAVLARKRPVLEAILKIKDMRLVNWEQVIRLGMNPATASQYMICINPNSEHLVISLPVIDWANQVPRPLYRKPLPRQVPTTLGTYRIQELAIRRLIHLYYRGYHPRVADAMILSNQLGLTQTQPPETNCDTSLGTTLLTTQES